jgi:hypothetical protein
LVVGVKVDEAVSPHTAMIGVDRKQQQPQADYFNTIHPRRPAGTVDEMSASEERRSSIERLSRARSSRDLSWAESGLAALDD